MGIMPTGESSAAGRVTDEAVSILMELAGIHVSSERVPEVATLVRATYAMIADLESVDLTDVALDQGFDAAWSSAEAS